MGLTGRDWRALLRLSGELAEIAENDPVAAADHALDSLYRITGADEGFLLFSVLALPEGARTDPLRGWRPVHTLYNRRSEERTRLVAEWYREPSRILENPSARKMARSAGRTRTLLRRDLTGGRHSAEAGLYAELGVADHITGGTPIARGAEAFIGLDALRGTRNFTRRHRRVTHVALAHLRWFFRRLARHHGLLAPPLPSFSPREAETLRRLLGSSSKKSIAAEMGISVLTLNEYVKGVYRKLEVGSRAELTSRFATAPLPHSPNVVRSVPYHSPRGLGFELIAVGAGADAEGEADGSAGDAA